MKNYSYEIVSQAEQAKTDWMLYYLRDRPASADMPYEEQVQRVKKLARHLGWRFQNKSVWGEWLERGNKWPTEAEMVTTAEMAKSVRIAPPGSGPYSQRAFEWMEVEPLKAEAIMLARAGR